MFKPAGLGIGVKAVIRPRHKPTWIAVAFGFGIDGILMADSAALYFAADHGEGGFRHELQSVPDAAGGVDDEAELGPLLVFGEKISFHGGSEAALRAEGHVFEREVARGLVDALDQLVGVFKLRTLGADKAEDDRLIARYETQRLEGAGARVVVFEQEAVYVHGGEELFGDGIVAAFGVPVAAIISAAEMNGQGNAGAARGGEAGVIGADGFVEHRVGIGIHLRANPFAPLGVHVVAVARRVDLNVGHAFGGWRASSFFMISTMSHSRAE